MPLRIALTDDTARADKQHSPLLELLERYHYIVLLGDPGSGKSTVVRHLAWSHAYANEESKEARQILIAFAHRKDIPVAQAIQVAGCLSVSGTH